MEDKGITTVELRKIGTNIILNLYNVSSNTPVEKYENLRRLEILSDQKIERISAYLEHFETVEAKSISLKSKIEFVGFQPIFKEVAIDHIGSKCGRSLWENRWNTEEGLIIFSISIPFTMQLPETFITRQ